MSDPVAPDGPEEDLEIDTEDDDPGLDPAVLRRRRDLALTILAGVLILAVSIFAATKFLRQRPRSEADVLLVVQSEVKRQVGPGMAIQFAPESRDVVALGSGRYRVSGMFLAVGRDGVTVYSAFECAVQDGPDGELQVSSVNITPLF